MVGVVVSRGQSPVTDSLGADARPDGSAPGAGLLQMELSAGAIPALVLPAPVILGANSIANQEMLVGYQGRWRLEVTLAESKAHLGVATQRQWSALAIARSMPGWLGLFSVVVLCGYALHPNGTLPMVQAACYPKDQATFSAVLARVRHELWRGELLDRPNSTGEQITRRYADLVRVMQAAA